MVFHYVDVVIVLRSNAVISPIDINSCFLFCTGVLDISLFSARSIHHWDNSPLEARCAKPIVLLLTCAKPRSKFPEMSRNTLVTELWGLFSVTLILPSSMKGWEQIVLKEDFFKQIITFQKPCTANQELKQKI